MKSVFNPTSEELKFTYDSAIYTLKAGEKKEFVDYVADMAAKRLADRETKTTNPDEHRVLTTAYLENSDPEVIAKNLGVDLDKIRAEAMTKEKEQARVINLEATVIEMRKEIQAMKEATAKIEKEELKPDELSKEEIEKGVEIPRESDPVDEEEKVDEKIDRRTKEYKDSIK